MSKEDAVTKAYEAWCLSEEGKDTIARLNLSIDDFATREMKRHLEDMKRKGEYKIEWDEDFLSFP